MNEEKKTVFLVEKIPGFDMRLKMQGDPVEIIQMLQGAMATCPELVVILECAIDTLPFFKAAVKTTVTRDFTGKRQQ